MNNISRQRHRFHPLSDTADTASTATTASPPPELRDTPPGLADGTGSTTETTGFPQVFAAPAPGHPEYEDYLDAVLTQGPSDSYPGCLCR